jgi:hypothetical protein
VIIFLEYFRLLGFRGFFGCFSCMCMRISYMFVKVGLYGFSVEVGLMFVIVCLRMVL